MGRFYGLKILKQEINAVTGAPWKLDDVPRLWRAATKKWLGETGV